MRRRGFRMSRSRRRGSRRSGLGAFGVSRGDLLRRKSGPGLLISIARLPKRLEEAVFRSKRLQHARERRRQRHAGGRNARLDLH
jgi:hypothetical protein